MKIVIPEKLKELNSYLPNVYVTGGFVRNSILGIGNTDLDICGVYTPEQVGKKLEGSGFSAAVVNKKLGTLKIFSEGFAAEYTTFRRDNYPDSGAHLPIEVRFTASVEEDCLRRDFKINALYASVESGEVLDFSGGADDLKAGIISTCRAPEEVFAEDGLRILRMVRLAAELGFTVESETAAVAKKMSARLADISAERIRDEFKKILVADTKYPSLKCADAPVKGVKMLVETGAMKYILPELLDGKGLKQDSRYHIYDVFEHSLCTMAECPPALRLAGLMHDIGKPLSLAKFGNMYSHSELGVEIAERRLGGGGLKFPIAEKELVKRLIATHMYDLDGQASVKKIRRFIVKNRDILSDVCALKRADAKASKGVSVEPLAVIKIENEYKKMKEEGAPFSIADLLVKGDDLIASNVPPNKRAEALNGLLELAVCDENLRTKEAQLKYIGGFVKNDNS